MTRAGIKQLDTDDMWPKQNCLIYRLHDEGIKIWLILNTIIWIILIVNEWEIMWIDQEKSKGVYIDESILGVL